MSPYSQLNTLLFLAVVGLGSFVFWWHPANHVVETLQPFATCNPSAVQRIVIEHRDHSTLTFARTGATWRLETPFAAPASAYPVQRLLELCQATSQSHYPLASLDPVPLGLIPPQTVVRLDDTEFRMGTSEPVQGQRYVLFKDTVYLISDIHYPTEEDVTRFIDPALLPEGLSITALSLPVLANGHAVEAVLRDGHWDMQPPRPDLSADALPTLVDGWRRARAMEVRRDTPSAPLGVVTITLAGVGQPETGQTLRFEVLALAPEVVLRRIDLGLRYVLPYDAAIDLLRLPVATEGG